MCKENSIQTEVHFSPIKTLSTSKSFKNTSVKMVQHPKVHDTIADDFTIRYLLIHLVDEQDW